MKTSTKMTTTIVKDINNWLAVEMNFDANYSQMPHIYRSYKVRNTDATMYVSLPHPDHPFFSFFLEIPSYQEGFGRATFKLKLDDGTTRSVTGPWSSNPSAVFAATGIHLVDVVCKFNDKRGCTYIDRQTLENTLTNPEVLDLYDKEWPIDDKERPINTQS